MQQHENASHIRLISYKYFRYVLEDIFFRKIKFVTEIPSLTPIRHLIINFTYREGKTILIKQMCVSGCG